MKRYISRKCENVECANIFLSSKSIYCCIECRKAGSYARRIKTNIQRYGVENPYQCDKVKNKIKTSNLGKYGVENPMMVKSINDKAHDTMFDRYGFRHALQSVSILDKMQETMFGRYGGNTTLTSTSLVQKYKNSMISRYNVEFPSTIHISEENYKLLSDRLWLAEQNKDKSIREICEFLGVGQSVVNKKFREFEIIPTQFKTSNFEKDIREVLRSLDIEYEPNNRIILSGKELDIYIPEYKLAIECNGSYWHSELNGKNKEYHLDKTLICIDQEIELIHIWEHDWILKNKIIRSILLNKFNKLKRIYARKCSIQLLATNDEREFLNKNHIQGYCQSDTAIGLYLGKELMSAMTFGRCRYNHSIELLRFCNKIEHTVIGGASKLFKHYINSNDSSEIISYSHRDKFTGNLYRNLDFKYSHSSPPAYHYTKDYINFENRLKYQKHKLPSLLEKFDAKLTEWDNMQLNGYDRIWDCGNDVWKWSRYDKE